MSQSKPELPLRSDGELIRDRRGWVVAQIDTGGIGRPSLTNAQIRELAALFAAAPELFQLAQDAVEILTVLIESREEEIGEEDEVARDLLARTKALIAKATPTDTPGVG